MGKRARWTLPAAGPEDSAALAKTLGLQPLAARVLLARGVNDPDVARSFLNPSLDELCDPSELRGLPCAVERIERAIRDRERILIYGDYDVDGTVSVVLLTKAIEMAGGATAYHVPHRLHEGYGMRLEVVEQAAAEGVKLIVSVDTGIRAGAVVARAAELGIETIVTDHHLPEAALPPALAVLNPNRPDCSYPNKHLCGAGVVFKLVQALVARRGWKPEKVRRITESFLKLAAIATVADVVPLTGENRVIVKHGLNGLHEVRNAGLRALLDVAGFRGGQAPDARQVAFQIAPRLNAAGRMDTARAAIELFLTADAERARCLAQELHDRNAERQQVEAAIRGVCEQTVIEESAVALIYYDASWHRGVLGIVASRLVEHTHRPVFVLGRNPADGLVQGSGRSIPAFHLLEALEAMPDLFVRFGGHAHAAGVTLEAHRVEEFRHRLNAFAAARLGLDDLLREFRVDAAVSFDEITDRSVAEVFRLAPFGHGNPTPLFLARNVEVAGPPASWKEKHLRVTVRQGGRTLALKAWRFAERAAEMSSGSHLDLLFSFEDDAYAAARGYPGWAAILRDVRPAEAAESGTKQFEATAT